MGQEMGTLLTAGIDLKQDDRPTFRHDAGFQYARKARDASDICELHMYSARIPIKYRDYCANVLMDYQTCRYENWPFVFKCHHEKHAYLNCEETDYVLRMKEFERERRLREREIRLKNPPKEKEKC